MYAGQCEQLLWLSSDSEKFSTPSLSAGDKVTIVWSSIHGGNFDWNLEEVAYREGDICTLPTTASQGYNYVPQSDLNEYWYRYTVPSAAVVNINSSSQRSVTIYEGSCGALTYIDGGTGNATHSNANAGDEILIKWWSNGSSISWDLELLPISIGDNCSVADTALQGINNVPASDLSHYWSSYQFLSNGKVQVEFPEDQRCYVYSGSCDDLHRKYFSGNIYTFEGYSAGEQLFFRWDAREYESFEWNLEFIAESKGDRCEYPDTAITGTNTMPVTSNEIYWYTYTMPSDGKLQIISVV